MVRAVVNSLSCLGLGVFALVAASTLPEPQASETFGSDQVFWSLLLSFVGFLTSAGLCLLAGSRRVVPSLVALLLPSVGALLAGFSILSVATHMAAELVGLGPVEVTDATARAGAMVDGRVGIALLVSGLAFLTTCLVGASAREDAYEPASMDPLRWVWAGVGVAAAALAAIAVVGPAQAFQTLARPEGMGIAAAIAALAVGPAVMIPLGRKSHDLSHGPAKRLSAARALGACGLFLSVLCLALAAPLLASSHWLRAVAEATGPAGQRAALEGGSSLAAAYDASRSLALIVIAGAIVVAGLVLTRAFRRPLSWVPSVAASAVVCGMLFWTVSTSRQRTTAGLGPVCEEGCLPDEAILPIFAQRTLPSLAPGDECDAAASFLPRRTSSVTPTVIPTASCAVEAGPVVVLSRGAIEIGGRQIAGAGGTTLEGEARAATRRALRDAMDQAPSGPESPLWIVADEQAPSGLFDGLRAAATAEGLTDIRFAVVHPSRTDPPAWRALPVPSPRRRETEAQEETCAGGSATTLSVGSWRGRCGGLHHAGPCMALEAESDTPCPQGIEPQAERWTLRLTEAGGHLAGPWGQAVESDSLTALAAGIERTSAPARYLAISRGNEVPIARELEARLALVHPELFAAAHGPDGEAGGTAGRGSWAISFGGPGDDAVTDVRATANGGVIVRGEFAAWADLDPGPAIDEHRGRGNRNGLVMGLDANGERQWAVALPGIRSPRSGGLDAAADGSMVLCGDFRGDVDLDPGPETTVGSSLGERGAYLARLEPDGTLAWSHTLGSVGTRIEGRRASQSSSGSMIFAGAFSGPVDFDGEGPAAAPPQTGVSDVFVTVHDMSGNLRWARTIGGSGAEWPAAVASDEEGGVVLVGQFNGTMDFDPGEGTTELTARRYGDMFLARLDGQGNLSWARAIGSPDGSGRPIGFDLRIAQSGSILVAGSFTGSVDFNPGTAPQVSHAGPTGHERCFVASYSSGGDLEWHRVFSGPYETAARALAIGEDGTVFVVGLFTIAADFDPGEGIEDHTSAGDADAFIVALSGSGEYLGGRAFGGTGRDLATSIAVAGDGSLLVGGAFSGRADLDPGRGIDEHTAHGALDPFVLRLPREVIIDSPVE